MRISYILMQETSYFCTGGTVRFSFSDWLKAAQLCGPQGEAPQNKINFTSSIILRALCVISDCFPCPLQQADATGK